MLQHTDELKKIEERIKKAQKRRRIVARIVKSTYRSDFFENKICEMDNPNSTLDLFMCIEDESYLLGPIFNIDKKKRWKKEYWTVTSYLGTLTLEIISQPVQTKVKRKNQLAFDIRNTIRKIQDINKNTLNIACVNKLADKLVTMIEDWIDSKSSFFNKNNSEEERKSNNNTRCSELNSDNVIVSTSYRFI